MTDDFDSILDQCVTALAAHQLTVDECLRRYPHYADQLAPLLRAASQVSIAPAIPALSPDTRRAIEQRVLSRAAQLSSAKPLPQTRQTSRQPLFRRWQTWAAIALALILISAGTVTASANSLPGEALYQVKLWSEQISLTFAKPADEPAVLAQIAQHRVAEFNTLAARGDFRPELMDEAAATIATALQKTETLTGDQQQAALQTILIVADDQLAALTDQTDLAPSNVQSQLQSYSQTVQTVRDRALGLTQSDQTPKHTPEPGKDKTPTETTDATAAGPQDTATPKKTLPVVAATDRPTVPTHTPKPTNAPPGQSGNTPKPSNTPRPPNTPPGQVVNTPKPSSTPKPPNTPPGQVDKTPKPTKTPKLK
ncbi:MAG: DUF5667 domain-containing protein [Anaerolineae bacterium]